MGESIKTNLNFIFRSPLLRVLLMMIGKVVFFVAINKSRNGSTLFVFTDADAKDNDKQQEAANMAMAKTITITTFSTGTCSRRRRSVHSKYT